MHLRGRRLLTTAFAALLAVACSKPEPAPATPRPRPPSLSTVRRTVESMLGQVLRCDQYTNLESCLLRLASTAAGRAELAALADASPLATWDATSQVFFYTYYYVFQDRGAAVRGIGPEGRERHGVAILPLPGVQILDLACADGQLRVRCEVETTGHRFEFGTGKKYTVLEPGCRYELLLERQSTAVPVRYEHFATRAVD